jgi:hypothetical protein
MTTSSFDSLNLNVNLMYDKLIKFTIYKTMELIEENPDFLEDKELSVQDLFETISETINYKLTGLTIKTPRVKKELTDNTTRTRDVLDEDRCMCRTMYHKIHLNSDRKTLKIMRDDPKNLYGDRCKNRKSSKPGSLFCTRHSTDQPYGIWNGIYDGECLKFVNNTEGKTVTTKKPIATNATKKTSSDNDSPLNECLIDSDNETKPPKKEKKSSSKGKLKKTSSDNDCLIDSDNETKPPKKENKSSSKDKFKKTSSDNDCLIDSDGLVDETKPPKKEKKIRMDISLDDIDAFIAKQVAAPSGAALVARRATQKKPLDKPQETVNKSQGEQETNQVALDDGKELDEIETEEIIIDDVVYNIDCENNLYNDDGEFLGKYDHSKNIIIKP